MFCHLLLIAFALADMMDVIEKTKIAPAGCKNGCAPWSEYPATLWHAGKVPADAANHCAQPGRAVNDQEYGSWCYCSNTTTDESTASDSPLSNKAFNFINQGNGSSDPSFGESISFTGQNVELYDKSATEQGVWYMIPIDDDPHVMTFYISNLWRCPSERRCGQWFSFTGDAMVLDPRGDTTDKVPWKLVLVNGTADTYHLQNLWHCPSDHR